jgi:hypothetical protein
MLDISHQLTQLEGYGCQSGTSCDWPCRLSVPELALPCSTSPFSSSALTSSPPGTEGSPPHHPKPTAMSASGLLPQLPLLLPLPVMRSGSNVLTSWEPEPQS